MTLAQPACCTVKTASQFPSHPISYHYQRHNGMHYFIFLGVVYIPKHKPYLQ